MTENIKDKLSKILTLAQRGVGGEKKSAQLTLDRLMKKYNVTEDELRDDVKSEYIFKYRTKNEYLLLIQIVYMVEDGTFGRSFKYKNKRISFELTKVQFIEVSCFYSSYKEALKKELALVFQAFIQKNSIFPINGETKDIDKATIKELQNYKNILNTQKFSVVLLSESELLG